MKNELSRELNRFYFFIDTFKNVIDSIENELKDSKQWFIFCSKIGKKFHAHLTSFVFNTTQDLLNIKIDKIEISNILDISMLYANLRMQLDTYATFYHIYMHDGDWDEKVIRFRLWQLDSLLSRQNFSHDRIPEKEQQVVNEKNEILEIYKIISDLKLFKDLTDKQKERLIKRDNNFFKYANWKFDKSLLTGKKSKYSWDDLALNTGINNNIYSDMHSFTSMHVHSNYISILQNDQLTQDEKHEVRIVGLRLSSYLISFFLDDLCNRFNSAMKVAESLKDNEIEMIGSFIKSGREKNKRKYFA